MKLILLLALVGSVFAKPSPDLATAVKKLHEGDNRPVRAIIRPMDPAQFESYLAEQESGRAAVSKYFDQDPEEVLGAFVPRTKFNSEEDQRKYDQAGE
jgi:hypothetical protein